MFRARSNSEGQGSLTGAEWLAVWFPRGGVGDRYQDHFEPHLPPLWTFLRDMCTSLDYSLYISREWPR